jgi:hypothetical protein
MTADHAANDDHPQTIKNESDARGSAGSQQQPPRYESLREEASAVPLRDENGQIRHDIGAGETIGDALRNGAGLGVGSGTPSDRGELGGGDAPSATDGVDAAGTYKPGESRD